MKVFKIFVDFEKEEKYLNDMAKNGYLLKKYSSLGFYHFIKDKPKDLKYRIDYRGFNKKSEFENYKAMFEDAGWQHVYGTKYSYNQYFLSKEENNDEDIFSTLESKAERYKRASNAFIGTSLITFLYIIISLKLLNLSTLAFLTPGLWDMNGINFWKAFFFELPFVILRTVPILLLFSLSIIYGIWAYKSRKIYKQEKNSLIDNIFDKIRF